ncbi:MAG: pyridoxamine 5'-phosphate oxidase family protein [Solirubrobacteraceae bacterium]|nr:MAG: pyridoxamine 5'-phosphate oxidase [Solirubrobacterales bacterium]
MSRREQIKLSDDEVAALLDQQRTIICASLSPDGWPHLMPLWYVVRDGELWSWTYARSQKVRNLERDPRCTLQVETGTEYQQLRGVMLKARAEIHRDSDDVAALGREIFTRYARGEDGELAEEVKQMVAKQATKRVALHFVESSRATWDHRKLGGVY